MTNNMHFQLEEMEPFEEEKVQVKEIEVVELMRLTASVEAFNP
jgi:hypothetical protein